MGRRLAIYQEALFDQQIEGLGRQLIAQKLLGHFRRVQAEQGIPAGLEPIAQARPVFVAIPSIRG